MTPLRVPSVKNCRWRSILAKAIAAVGYLSMALLFTSSPVRAEIIFSEAFDSPLPQDLRVLFEADAIYDGIADPAVTGGDATPNDYYNGMIVRSWGAGLITSDQSGGGYFLHNRTTCDFVPTDYQGQFWGTLEPIEVLPSSSYAFSFYLTNENTVLDAQIQLRINDQDIGPPLSAKGRHATNGWQRFAVQWDSGDATTADLGLFNVLSNCNGNDFGTDTITFTLVPEPSSVGLAAIAGLCSLVLCRRASAKSRRVCRGAGQPASRDKRAVWTVVTVSVVTVVIPFLQMPKCRAVTIFDGEFADDDWTHEKV